MKVFISYCQEDKGLYSILRRTLSDNGITLWDESSLRPGQLLADQLRTAIGQCDICIFLATSCSLRSQWCLTELGAFWGASKTVMIYSADATIDKSQLPPQFEGNKLTSDVEQLINAIRQAPPESQRPIFSGDISVNARAIGSIGPRIINIRRISGQSPSNQSPIALDWLSLGRGIQRIENQIKCLPTPHIEAIVGVNYCGAIIASYLCGTCALEKRMETPLVCVTSSAKNPATHERKYFRFPFDRLESTVLADSKYCREKLFPPGKRFAGVLVVDSEYKSGYSLRRITDIIEKNHLQPGGEVYLAVLVGCGINTAVDERPGISVEDVFKNSTYDPTQCAERQSLPFRPPDFLAYITDGRVEPPGPIR
jgi:hypothetical protein